MFLPSMKFAVSMIVAAVLVAAQAAPAVEQKAPAARPVRQVAPAYNNAAIPNNSPLSQLLQDSLFVSPKFASNRRKFSFSATKF